MRLTVTIAAAFFAFAGFTKSVVAQQDFRYLSVVCDHAEDVVGVLRTRSFSSYQYSLRQKGCLEIPVTGEVYGRPVLGFAVQNGEKYCVLRIEVSLDGREVTKFQSAPVAHESKCVDRA